MNDDAPANGVKLPARLRVRFFAGADGSFELYEDDGETQSWQDGAFALTNFSQRLVGDILELKKSPVSGKPAEVAGFPLVRDYVFEIAGINEPTGVLVVNGKAENAVESAYDSARPSS